MTPQSRPHLARPVPVILTRPAEQSARFAQMLAERFGDALQIITSPLMAPVFLSADLSGSAAQALILTSETGAKAAGGLPGLPRQAWCVGDRTAEAARAAGFAAQSAGGDADALVATLLSARPTGPLLHLRGQDSRGDVAHRLTRAGLPTAEAVVYAQQEQPLTAPAAQLLRGPDPVLVPLFSPRSAKLFAGTRPLAPVLVAAFSPAVAQALGDLVPAHLSIATRPDAAAMIDAIVPLITASRA